MENMFGGCESLKSLDISNFDTSKVINMYGMFGLCSSLKTIYLNNPNTRTKLTPLIPSGANFYTKQ
jgi:surface protein